MAATATSGENPDPLIPLGDVRTSLGVGIYRSLGQNIYMEKK